MHEVPEPVLQGIDVPSDLRLIVVPEPWFQVFLRNLCDLLRFEPNVVSYAGDPGTFWPDVFVRSRLPWRRFFESGIYHVFAVVFLCEVSQFLVLQPQIITRPTFKPVDVIYYAPSEYLPPLDTRRDAPAAPQKADPEIAKQPIISVPPEADNHSQTIVTPPKVRLPHDVPLPNTVAWSHKPEMPIAPAPVVPASQISRLAPQMQQVVITPPPAGLADGAFALQKAISAPQPSVIAPAPELSAAENRRFGNINIAQSPVIAPAPQLPVDAQRTAGARRPLAAQGSPQVIAPPPYIAASGGSRSGGDIVALSLHPAVGAPPTPVAGNRRGTFAAAPEGHAGATGNLGNPATSLGANRNGAGNNKAGDLPSGLYVGKSPNPSSTIAGELQPASSGVNSVNPKLIANARPPRFEPAVPSSETKISEAERAVFGGRKIYSLSLNMPNLNSAGGSWIIRFASLKQGSDGVRPSADPPANDLSSPVATRKVDPAYPLELMRQNVAGTVILYGIIRADGTVSDVRVLRSVDDRLDRFASEALAKWQFRPATKNGTAVDVEATFWIPFQPVRAGTDF
jgi:TonB family protein